MRVFAVCVLLLSFVAFARPADANPNKVFNGQIKLSDKRFPTQAKSPGAYTAAIKKQAKTNFYENKEIKGWKLYMIGFLKRPLNDMEYIVKITDVRSRQLLASFEQFTTDRGEKTLTSNISLDREKFGVNRELQITMEGGGTVLASGRFKILGEGEKFTGKVDFSEDEANGKE
jgi:hypothetical protein